MNMEEVFQFSCLKTVEPVIVAGEQGSGKTTLEVMMYRLFQEGKKDTIIKFVNDKYQSLKESFAPNVGKMDLCYLYAYGIAEKEEKEKMEELLLNFMKRFERDLCGESFR